MRVSSCDIPGVDNVFLGGFFLARFIFVVGCFINSITSSYRLIEYYSGLIGCLKLIEYHIIASTCCMAIYNHKRCSVFVVDMLR